MILVDTSVWVDHFRGVTRGLTQMLDEDEVLVHPFVIGELALSGLVNRQKIVMLLQNLPHTEEATHDEALGALRRWKLDGRGVGWVDVHLFASALLSECLIWTADEKLRSVCGEAGIAFAEPWASP